MSYLTYRWCRHISLFHFYGVCADNRPQSFSRFNENISRPCRNALSTLSVRFAHLEREAIFRIKRFVKWVGIAKLLILFCDILIGFRELLICVDWNDRRVLSLFHPFLTRFERVFDWFFSLLGVFLHHFKLLFRFLDRRFIASDTNSWFNFRFLRLNRSLVLVVISCVHNFFSVNIIKSL